MDYDYGNVLRTSLSNIILQKRLTTNILPDIFVKVIYLKIKRRLWFAEWKI